MRCNSSASLVVVLCGAIAACATGAAPVQQLADTEASIRSAHDSYAVATPSAQLHLKLAEEAAMQARHAMDGGDERRAAFLLLRARADAELALGEERQAKTEAEAQQVGEALSQIQETGTEATSATRTTGAIVPAPAALPPSSAPPAPPPSTSNGTGGPQ
jgi:hypothetical protein